MKLEVPESEVELSAVRSQGAGGQNVNKVSSAIHLRFDIPASSLPEDVKARLLALADQRITQAGVLVIKAQTAAQPGAEPGRGAAPAAGSGRQRGDAAARAQADQADLRLEAAPPRRQGRAQRGEEPARQGAQGRVSARGDNPCMAREKTIYTCSECGGISPKWLGKCPSCGAWNTLEEGIAEPAAGAAKNHRFQSLTRSLPVTTLAEIEASEVERTPTGVEELDRVLGGGIVEGGVVLIGGDPGIGKSTLLLQALDSLSRSMKTLYITGEESGAQVALRARRLGLDASKVRVLAEINLENILATLDAERPSVA